MASLVFKVIQKIFSGKMKSFALCFAHRDFLARWRYRLLLEHLQAELYYETEEPSLPLHACPPLQGR
jgi:hypothetical protein